MSFRKGQQVLRRLIYAGVSTEEVATVLHVRKGQVWLDNGPGNDPSGPFSAVDGRFLGWELGTSSIRALGQEKET